MGIFEHEFLVRGLIAGMVTALVAPSVGLLLLTRRLTFLADTLSHVALAGLAAASLVGVAPLAAAAVASVGTAVTVDALRARGRLSGDAGLSLFLSGGLAVAAVLLSKGGGQGLQLGSMLFGSLVTVSWGEVWLIGAMATATLFALLLLRHQLVAVSVDPETAAASGVSVRLVDASLAVLAALTVSVSLRAVGVLLVSALMVIPSLAALELKQGLKRTFLASILFAEVAVIVGLQAALTFDISAGGAIVLVALAEYLLCSLVRSGLRLG
ncbi:MAG: metal ABC transporter permease [Candidatus Peribacteraceae bacterium]|nr:metal ABC transporter permease [Candidatus Peribacteraceae bacterium]